MALILPDLTPETEAVGLPESDAAGPLEPGATDADVTVESAIEMQLGVDLLRRDISVVRPVAIRRSHVPDDLDPARFFHLMCDHLLDTTPVNFHVEARRRRREAP